MRLLVNKGFTPRRVGALEQRIRAIVDDIIERASAAGSFDLVTDVAVELPLQVIAELVGVPAEDRHQVFSWTEQTMSGDDPEFANGPEEIMAALGSMYMYAEGLCEQRRAEPRDDLISVLLEAEITTDDGTKARLTQQEIDVFFLLLQNAGSETTRNLITGGTLALLEHPDQLAALQADPDGIPVAVEELLRWVTPVTHFARTLTHDDVIAGQAMQAGEKVVLWYSSANRDEATFADPDVLDLARQPNEHVVVRRGRPALLPRRVAGPPRGPGDLRGARPDRLPPGADRPARAPALELHQRHQAPAGPPEVAGGRPAPTGRTGDGDRTSGGAPGFIPRGRAGLRRVLPRPLRRRGPGVDGGDGERGRAEDAAQEAFARALRRWSRVGPMDRPATWVYVVAVNVLRRSFRVDDRAAESVPGSTRLWRRPTTPSRWPPR